MTLYLTAKTIQKSLACQGNVLVRPDFKSQPRKAGVCYLAFLNQKGKLYTLNTLKDLISETSFSLGTSIGWIYSPTATRDKHSSSVAHNIELIQRIELTLTNNLNENFQLSINNPYVASALIMHLRKKNFLIKITIQSKLIWFFRRIILFSKTILIVIRTAINWLDIIHSAKKYPVKNYKPLKRDTVIFSIFHNSPGYQKDGRKGDTYFGELSKFLKSTGQKILTCGYVLSSSETISKSLADSSKLNSTFGHHLGYIDIIQTIRETMIALLGALIHLQHKSSKNTLDKLVFGDLLTATSVIYASIIIEKAVGKLLLKNPANQIIIMHENNPWELAVIRASRRVNPEVKIMGYIHCAILKSHLKHLTSSDQQSGRPYPDKIICTGGKSKELYANISAFSLNDIFIGSNLSGPLLRDNNVRRSPPKKIKTILALMEGLPEMVGFIKFLAEVGKVIPNIKLLIRPHPIQFNLKELIDASGIIIEEGALLEPSNPAELNNAISEADAVIYKGSTAAFFALHQGLPLIHYNDDWIVSDDSLIGCRSLKWNVKKPNDIVKVIGDIESMTEYAFKGETNKARKYVEEYLTDPSCKLLKSFLN